MQKPATPHDEKLRLQTLHALNLLDTSPDEHFDRITRLAKRIFNVPIALVSLVDTDRQWFKSKQGLDVDETPRDISFCGHAIIEDDIFIVSDTLRDERFADNPLVTERPNIRFYAGYPLKVLNGFKLGTLCLIDQKPREFNEEDKKLLRDLAQLAEQELAAIQLATMDELTKISNRRGFTILAQHALNMSRRKNFEVSLVFLDLNKFKKINDQYGHAEGDRALINFTDLIIKTFRESDIYARLGGDEFVVLLTDTPLETVESILSRFDQEISQYNKTSLRGYNIQYSSGIAIYDPDKHQSIDDLLAEADTMMYRQKQSASSVL